MTEQPGAAPAASEVFGLLRSYVDPEGREARPMEWVAFLTLKDVREEFGIPEDWIAELQRGLDVPWISDYDGYGFTETLVPLDGSWGPQPPVIGPSAQGGAWDGD